MYREEMPEGLEGVLDVGMEAVMGLVDEWMEVVKGSSKSGSQEDDNEEEGEERDQMQKVVKCSAPSHPPVNSNKIDCILDCFMVQCEVQVYLDNGHESQ